MNRADKPGITAVEILLAVIRTWACRGLTDRTKFVGNQLRPLAGPAAFGTFHTVVNADEELIQRNFKRDGCIKLQVVVGQPAIEKNRLGQTPGKSIEDPTAGLAGKPIPEDGTHQLVRKILTPIKDGLGLLPKRSPVFHVFPEKCTGTKIAESETFGQPPPLSALARSRWPKQNNPERFGSRIDQ